MKIEIELFGIPLQRFRSIKRRRYRGMRDRDALRFFVEEYLNIVSNQIAGSPAEQPVPPGPPEEPPNPPEPKTSSRRQMQISKPKKYPT